MPVEREEIAHLVERDPSDPWVASVGSHSALDVADGAVSEGFRTLVLAQRGRERTYSQYYRTVRGSDGHVVRGCVDDVWLFDRFSEIGSPTVVERLNDRGALLVPSRAFSSYLALETIEDQFRVPLVGSRRMLRIEERSERENYYTLLAQAKMPIPEAVPDPTAIDGLSIVKLPHATKRLERGFFTVASRAEFDRKSATLIQRGTITPDDLAHARIERYVLGPVFNFNFFFSPLVPRNDGLELLGVDERRESSLDGLVRLPAAQQLEMNESDRIPEYTVVGHGTLTVRESLLEEVFRLGEAFVEASRTRYPPGILGPFCLQTCIDPNGRPTIFDVAVRIGGGTNIHLGVGHPYGNALYRGPMSTGRRVAREIREAIRLGRLAEIVT